MILIDALYINSFGGKVLLEVLIESIFLNDEIERYYFIFDSRLLSDFVEKIPNENKKILKPTEAHRKCTYKELLYSNQISSILCFANIPPPVSTKKIPVNIYFHNVLLLSTRASNYSIIKKATFWLKSVYIRFHNRPCYHWIVQSEMVKKLLKRHWGIDINKILVYPFFKEHFFKSNSIRKIDYLFVADGVPQKNHNFLFSTWELLATKYKFFPTLYTTINELRYTELSVKIKELKGKGINVVNIGTVSNDQLINLYQQTKYLIFPSLAESFGLPLIEASMVGCKVLASDLEYVDQVIDASALFDPKNSLELAELIHGIETNKINLPATNFKIKNKVVDILNHLKQYEYIQG